MLGEEVEFWVCSKVGTIANRMVRGRGGEEQLKMVLRFMTVTGISGGKYLGPGSIGSLFFYVLTARCLLNILSGYPGSFGSVGLD